MREIRPQLGVIPPALGPSSRGQAASASHAVKVESCPTAIRPTLSRNVLSGTRPDQILPGVYGYKGKTTLEMEFSFSFPTLSTECTSKSSG